MKRFMLFAGILLLAASQAARADIAPEPLITGGTSAAPKLAAGQACPVTMVAEEVDLYPSAAKNVVTARFVLKNTGDTDAELEVGFPSYFKMPLQDFKAEVDGQPQAAEVKNIDGGGKKSVFTYWMCWPMKLAKGQERKVTVRYSVETEHVYAKLHIKNLPAELKDKVWQRSSGYVLRTGAGWAGNIGKAVIRIHYGDGCPKDLMVTLLPKAGWQYDPQAKTDTLTLTDFEPTDKVAMVDSQVVNESDISYTFRVVDPQTEGKLLLAALKEKKLDPWAMQYLLDLVEKENVLKLSAAQQAAQVKEILEWMLPPQGPASYAQEISRGAERILENAFERLSKLYADAGETEKAQALSANHAKLVAWISADRAQRPKPARDTRK